MMQAAQRCQRCGALVNPGEVRGLCPACLLDTSLWPENEPDLEDSADGLWRSEAKPEPGTAVQRMGDYELLEEIGRGGMGVIYRARQVSLDRFVAVKTILTGPLASRDFVQRFQTEAHAAAVLEHPNIVPIYEVGNHQGQPFYSMRLISGRNLAQELKETGAMPPRRAAELVVTVARAVQYAHERGVLHRDLKPANILLDAEGNPHVTDFGLAKLLEHDDGLTLTQAALGTPNYMAPEVAEGGTRLSTVAVDVYGLGAVLYHVITGKPPFAATSALETLRRILDTEPAQPRTINPQIPGDLEAICLKALSRMPESRYASAAAMAEDLGRFLRQEPVTARPITRRQRLARWARRNPVAASLSGIIAFLALALLLGTPWALWRINSESNRAVQRAAEATEQKAKAERNLRREQVARVEMLFDTDHAVDAVALLGQLHEQNPSDRPLAEWIANELTHRNFALPIVGPLVHSDRVCLVRFSPDGRRLLTATRRNAAQVWDVSTGRPSGEPLEHQASVANAQEFLGGFHPLYAEFSPDGRRVATASVDNTAQVWDAETGSRLGVPLKHPNWVTFVRFSPDGQLLATACKDGLARLWDPATGQAVGSGFPHKKWVNSIAFSPDGKRVLTASDDKTARVWETASGKPLTAPLQHGDWVKAAVFSPDGRLVATACADGSARIWDAETGAPRTPPLAHGTSVNVIQFSPDGQWLATGGFSREVRIWRVSDGELHGHPLTHTASVRGIDFSPDGLRIVTASEDRTARVWDVTSGAPITESLRHDDVVWSACFSPDGGSVATASSDRTAFVWDVRPGKANAVSMETGAKPIGVHWLDLGESVLTLSTGGGYLYDAGSGRLISARNIGDGGKVLVAAPIGGSRRIFIATRSGDVGVWEAETAKQLGNKISDGAPLTGAALSPDEKLAATASKDGQLKIWDTLTARQVSSPLQHSAAVTRVEFGSDSRTVAVACEDCRVSLWRVPEGRAACAPLVHEAWIHDLVFSPDGGSLATASQDGLARVWDTRTGRLRYPALRHRGAVLDVDFSSDGRYLATASREGMARVWASATGRPVADRINLGPPVLDITFGPDGQWLALGGEDGRLGIWDIFTSQPLLTIARPSGRVYMCAFRPDGRRLAIASGGNRARVFDLVKSTGEPPSWLWELVNAVAGAGAEMMEGTGRANQGSMQALRSRLLLLPVNDEWSRWAHWFLADRAARTTTPLGTTRIDDLLLLRLDLGNIPSRAAYRDLMESLLIRPDYGDLYAQAAVVLASPYLSDEPNRLKTAEWLSRRALQLQRTPFLAQWARASYLDLAGDRAGAVAAIEQAMAAGSANAYFWLWSAALLEKEGRIERGAFAMSKAVEVAPLGVMLYTPQQLRQMHAEYLSRHGLSR